MSDWLIYGANGYTGTLIAKEAVSRGLRPVLAGRSRAMAEMATRLGLPHRIFGLDDAAAVREGLAGMTAVLHCAGPFAHTYRAVADACLAGHVHYLDVTGEIGVFEGLAALDAAARAANVMLLPGVGFDVVPSDCLAAHLKRRLPAATRLALGFQPGGGVSRGTAATMAENLDRGGAIRRGGVLRPVPAAWRTRSIDFGRGPVTAMTIPWGDVSTAYHSTGIPDVEVYVAAPWRLRTAARLSRWFGWLLRSGPVQRWLKGRIRSGPPGPSDEQRARGRSLLWGEACDAAGRCVVSRLEGPEGYTLTAQAAVRVVEHVLAGRVAPGFQTPSRLLGPDFVLELPGVTRTDEG
jgi:short subunit dehydrogenase-like uncharacterized protein